MVFRQYPISLHAPFVIPTPLPPVSPQAASVVPVLRLRLARGDFNDTTIRSVSRPRAREPEMREPALLPARELLAGHVAQMHRPAVPRGKLVQPAARVEFVKQRMHQRFQVSGFSRCDMGQPQNSTSALNY